MPIYTLRHNSLALWVKPHFAQRISLGGYLFFYSESVRDNRTVLSVHSFDLYILFTSELALTARPKKPGNDKTRPKKSKTTNFKNICPFLSPCLLLLFLFTVQCSQGVSPSHPKKTRKTKSCKNMFALLAFLPFWFSVFLPLSAFPSTSDVAVLLAPSLAALHVIMVHSLLCLWRILHFFFGNARLSPSSSVSLVAWGEGALGERSGEVKCVSLGERGGGLFVLFCSCCALPVLFVLLVRPALPFAH